MSLPGHIDAELLSLDPIRESLAALPQVDVPRMRQDHLDRLQAELQQRDLGGILLYDPINVRYAKDCRNMQIWTMHNSARYCFVPAEGKAVIFDYVNCEHLSTDNQTVGEIGAREGVKLEEMVRITETGCELVANYPFEDKLLS